MSVQRHTAYNLIGAVIPIAVSLVTIPLYLETIGQERYGVVALVWLLLGYFGVFDLGLGRATAQRIAASEKMSLDGQRQIFWTGFVANFGLGLVGAGALWPLASLLFGSFLKLDDGLIKEIQAVMPWMMLAVPLSTISGALTGTLQGRSSFLVLNITSVIGTVLFQVIPLLAAVHKGASLEVIVPSMILSRLLLIALQIAGCWSSLKGFGRLAFSLVEARHLVGFGGWVTITSFLVPIMAFLDRFAIGAISGAASVSLYSVPYQLAEKMTIIPAALSSALYPKFASGAAKEAGDLSVRSIKSLFLITTPIGIIGIIGIEPFLHFWISPEFSSQSAGVAKLLIMAFWLNGFERVPFSFLQSRGRPDIPAKCHLFEIFPFMVLLYFGLTYFGLTGAALAFVVRVALDLLLVSYFAGLLRIVFQLLALPALLMTLTIFGTWDLQISEGLLRLIGKSF